jgi:asparagine synthase (glutamine-hydrolysing)
MCGIYFCYHRGHGQPAVNHEMLKRRGPDAEQVISTDDYTAMFYRLAIVGVSDGMQPFRLGNCILLCNGEIYNHQELSDMSRQSTTGSDCECIIWMYKMHGIEKTLELLDGEFAFVLYDLEKQVIHFARDRLGRKPLFFNAFADELDDDKLEGIEMSSLYSGLSAMELSDAQFDKQVQPGHLYTYDVPGKNLAVQLFHRFMFKPGGHTAHSEDIRDALFAGVVKRITQSERPVGFLLSGGFDSSLVLSMALASGAMKQPPHVFTIGFEEKASDVLAAEYMVNWLKEKYGEQCIIWHKVILPLESGLKRIPEVIQALETYDTTTIRASTPMYLISEYIAKNTDVKVVLSGEGSDELFGGYLYFKYAPNDVSFRAEVLSLLHGLYLYDVLRADRSTASHGLEIRPPFLDDDLVAIVLQCRDLVGSQMTTKELIRNAVAGSDLLPNAILWGKKEAFSDAVGLSWKESIVLYAKSELQKITEKFSGSPHIDADTDESKYFQYHFGKLYPGAWELLPSLWLPNQAWVKTGSEPSARVLDVYKS